MGGSIGSALPLSAAARLAFPGSRVVAMMGDGTFGFHAMELDTAVRHGLPLVAVVGNDAAWNAEYQIQLRDYGRDRLVGCELLPTRYSDVAIALGGYGERVSRLEELRPALQRALDSGLPACVDVRIGRNAAPNIRRGRIARQGPGYGAPPLDMTRAFQYNRNGPRRSQDTPKSSFYTGDDMPKFVFMPPQDDLKQMFAARLADTLPELEVASPDTDEEAIEAIRDADAACGWVPPAALKAARKLEWLHNPDAGPFFGYYYDELMAHPLTITNPRGIYFDHISHHILMFVMALSRGLPWYMDAQRRQGLGEERPEVALHLPGRGHGAHQRRRRHRPRDRPDMQRPGYGGHRHRAAPGA